MTFTRLTIPDPLLADVITHARAELPNECCGLLAGRIEGGVGVVTVRFAVRNDAASPTAYATNPRDMLAAFRSMREGGLELLAVYHSHPTGEPIPSKRDVAENTYGETAVHVIVALSGDAPRVRAWWITEAGWREAEWGVTTTSHL